MTDAVDEMETNQVEETFVKAIIRNMTIGQSYCSAGGGRGGKEERHGKELHTTIEGASEGEVHTSLGDNHRQRPSRRGSRTNETWNLDILHPTHLGHQQRLHRDRRRKFRGQGC
jgi:hypothetical protein